MSETVLCIAPAPLDFVFVPIERALKAIVPTGIAVMRVHELSLRESLLEHASVLLPWSGFPCTAEVMSSSPILRAVVCPFVGIEGIDCAAATDLGIVISNGATPESQISMAEATIMLMLASMYDLKGAERKLRSGGAPGGGPRLLQGKTVGLVGYGRIASAMTERLAPWGVAIVTCTRRLDQPLPAGVSRVSLEELLQVSDIVCLLTPLTAETRGLLGDRELRLMKSDAVLINTARGGLIDEEALARVAAERPQFRFALDTFASEPLPRTSALRQLENAILTPHCVGHTAELLAAIVDRAVGSTTRVLRGDLPIGIVNPQVEPVWVRKWSVGSVERSV